MKTIWQVNLDSFAGETLAKSGELFSVLQTARLIIEKYKAQEIKPEVEVVTIGLGIVLSDYLTDEGILHTKVGGLLSRVGGADIIKYRRE